MAVLEDYARKMDVRGMMITAVIASLGFVMAFFWNDAIKSAIEEIIPAGGKLTYKFVAAAMVTVIVIFAVWLLVKTNEISKKHEKELEKMVKRQSAKLNEQKRKIEEQAKKMRKGILRR